MGSWVGHAYDATGHLTTVTDVGGGVTTLAYDADGRMSSVTHARNINYLQIAYDTAGRVSTQTQADNSTFGFAYTTDGNGVITQVDVTDPKGGPRRHWAPTRATPSISGTTRS